MAETGLFYNYFRNYDPQVGGYLESDPIGLAGGSYSTYTSRYRWKVRNLYTGVAVQQQRHCLQH
jgi:RHS repeat-associated protein